jgi:hypothetical protein
MPDAGCTAARPLGLPDMLYTPKFQELCTDEVRLSPAPTGENFSGSRTVTSRNSLIHNAATNGANPVCFEGSGV